jgi:hypothetical protein
MTPESGSPRLGGPSCYARGVIMNISNPGGTHGDRTRDIYRDQRGHRADRPVNEAVAALPGRSIG